MALTDVALPAAIPAAYGRRPATVVARRTARAAARSGVIWGYVFGAFVASTAWSYTSIYRTQADREGLAIAFGANKATTALFGPAPDLQTVGGFTVFKVSITLMIIGAVWGLLTGTRLLRGEEDTGRWDLLLIGQTTRRAATGQAVIGLGAGVAALWALTALITAVAGLSSRVGIGAGDACFLALALASPALVFLAVGAVTSQFAPTRRQAAGWAAAVLGVGYALRMLGDAGLGLHALTWLSPLGWSEMLSPLTANDPVPLLPIFGTTAVLAAVAVVLAGQRDVGGSLVPDRSQRAPRLRLLGGQLAFSARLMAGTALSWLVALAIVGLLFGLVAQGAGSTLGNSSVQQVLAKLGATGGGVGAYLGVTFLMVAVLVSFAIAGQVGAAKAEEAEGRLDHLLARPLARTRWLGGRVGLAFALALALGFAGGLCTWLGALSQHTGFGAGTLLAAGVNASVPAVFFLGVGTLLFGLWPRAASAGVNAALAWSLLVELVGGIGAISHWLLDTSVFHHVAPAPSVPIDWASDGVLVALAAVAALVGAAAFTRRDVVGA
jgi:ABC-2 type transport system permease protein